jgi:hypothetical protein
MCPFGTKPHGPSLISMPEVMNPPLAGLGSHEPCPAPDTMSWAIAGRDKSQTGAAAGLVGRTREQ